MADKFFDAMFTAAVIGGSSGPAPVIVAKNITANGTYSAADDQANGYDPVIVDVPNTYTAGDEGKVVSSGSLVAQTATTYTANGTYDTTLNNSVTVNVASGSDFVSVTDFDYSTNYKSLLKSIAIPEGVTTISSLSFYGCSNLETLNLPNSLVSIGTRSFDSCTKLQNFIFPNGLTTLNYRAFYSCRALTYVELPSSITSIDNQAFGACTNIETIRIHKPQGSISGAPWGATNATVIWDD